MNDQYVPIDDYLASRARPTTHCRAAPLRRPVGRCHQQPANGRASCSTGFLGSPAGSSQPWRDAVPSPRHHPSVGRRPVGTSALREGISIRAPVRGATCRTPIQDLRWRRFNPRPRAGGDKHGAGGGVGVLGVSIRAPVRGRLDSARSCAGACWFQSAPPWGGGPHPLATRTHSPISNPRPRAGENGGAKVCHGSGGIIPLRAA